MLLVSGGDRAEMSRAVWRRVGRESGQETQSGKLEEIRREAS